MKNENNSLCVFVHYGTDSSIPHSVYLYLNELKRHFDQLILVTNNRPLNTDNELIDDKLRLLFVKNEGYDLGMFYKAFQTIDPRNYSQIACINDSNVLINNLDAVFEWSKQDLFDFWGIIDSRQKPAFSTHPENYHIQSHFIVFNTKAISMLPDFFEELQVQHIFNENNHKILRETVINKWEIGVSQYLLRKGLISGSYIDSCAFAQLHNANALENASLKLYPELIRSGYPLLKKKVITKGKIRDIFRRKNYWENLIRQFGNRNWNVDLLIDELNILKTELGN